ncbi:carbon dioxide-concentrating mechanism protein [Lyngbya confervoides]|uniref:BMC domain-containing protein n=1 Tax=Lyngbya confervoides BDU141951 TaxID=1574623 RepID=A0ABD4T2W2_9CYAN|nr:BMC domain-containing protein [Lyngbya confervoides]MCM1983043.1 BMC domain-containing protein [Lyngbya confervoides BDU141951]
MNEFKEQSALGLVATRSFPAMVGTADMMLKSAGVILVGYEKVGSGYCTAVVRGGLADVRLAVEAGAETAQKFGQLMSKLVIPRPLPNLEKILPIGTRLLLRRAQGKNRLTRYAVGLLETRGFPSMVGAADAMLKAADVRLAGYETVGDGLCTAIIRGSISNVTIAVEAGMYEAERIGELHAVMVIPNPLGDLDYALPTASCWLEEEPQPVPVMLPKEQVPQPVELLPMKEKELLELPHSQAKSQADRLELPVEPSQARDSLPGD